MEHIKGFDRQQMVLIPETIEQLIEQDNIVRVIDVFVDRGHRLTADPLTTLQTC